MSYLVTFQRSQTCLRAASVGFGVAAPLVIANDLSVSFAWLQLSTDAVALICVSAAFLFAAIFGYQRRIVHRRAIRSDFELCINCGYDLHSSSECQSCPECGERIDLGAYQALWRRLLK